MSLADFGNSGRNCDEYENAFFKARSSIAGAYDLVYTGINIPKLLVPGPFYGVILCRFSHETSDHDYYKR